MINLLGADTNNIGNIILIVVLALMLVAYMIFGFRSRKKNQEKAMKMMNELKAGDKIVTNAGVYGEIVSLRETNMGKVVTIKTGDEETKKISYLTINASVILGIDEKKDLILDKDGNVIDDEDENAKQELRKEVLKESVTESSEDKKEDATKKVKETKKQQTEVAESVEESNNETPVEEENEIINKIKTKNAKSKR